MQFLIGAQLHPRGNLSSVEIYYFASSTQGTDLVSHTEKNIAKKTKASRSETAVRTRYDPTRQLISESYLEHPVCADIQSLLVKRLGRGTATPYVYRKTRVKI